MTRFARAKGSKASNERVPEESTSWGEMKKQLVEKSKEAEETKKKREADKQREKNYKNFLKEVDEEEGKNTKWAEFPTTKVTQKKRKREKSVSEFPSKKKRAKSMQKPKSEVTETDVKKVTPKEVDKEGTKITKWAQFKNKRPKEKSVQKPKSVEGEEVGKAVSNEEETKNSKRAKFLSKKKREKSAKKPRSELTEEEVKKVEKKKQKRLRQLEKKKLGNQQKPAPKVKGNKKHDRRKKPQDSMIINGKEVPIAYVDGFPIKKEDAERIHKLRRQMISKGLPRSEIKIALKLERRKAEKAFARERKKVCFNCRKSGHNLSECPEVGQQQLAESAGTGICFKCGSTEHTHFECKVVRGQEFKFAQCFICQEQGHIARQCPDNARGLYPKGGACRVCGDVTHLKKDCPKYQAQQRQLEESVQIETINSNDNPDSLGQSEQITQTKKKINKIIKF